MPQFRELDESVTDEFNAFKSPDPLDTSIEDIPADELGLQGDPTPVADIPPSQLDSTGGVVEPPENLERDFLVQSIREGLTLKQARTFLQQAGVPDSEIDVEARSIYDELVVAAKAEDSDDTEFRGELDALGYSGSPEKPDTIPVSSRSSQQRAARRQAERKQQRVIAKAEAFDEKRADLFTKYKAVLQKPYDTLHGLRAAFSSDPAVKAEALDDSIDLGLGIAAGMTRHGIEAKVDPLTGDVLTKDKMGNWSKVDLDFFDSFVRDSMAEAEVIAGATAGGASAFRHAPPHPAAKAAATVGGAAIGAFSGSMVSHVRNSLALKEQIDFELMLEQAKQAGVVEAAIGILGTGVVEVGARSGKKILEGLMKAKDYLADGRKGESFDIMIQHLGLSREEAFQKVRELEGVLEAERPDLDDIDKAFAWLPKYSSDGAAILGRAAKLNPTESLRVKRDIENRSLDVMKSMDEATVDHMGAVIVNEMDAYRNTVKDNFGSVSKAAIDAVDGKGYTFDYDEIGIEPVINKMESRVDIFNNQKFLNQMHKIREAGNRDLDTGNKVKFINEAVTKGEDEFGRPFSTKEIDNLVSSKKGLTSTKGSTTTLKESPELTTKEGSVSTTVTPTPKEPVELTLKDLFKLRSHINGLKFNAGATQAAESSGIEKVLTKINSEIDKVVRLNMSKEEGDEWAKQWAGANREYHKFKNIEASVINKALTKEGTDYKTIATDVLSYVKASDGTYSDFAGVLSPNAKRNLDGAVLKSAAEKFTSKSTGIIDFEGLMGYLKDINFESPHAAKLKKGLRELAVHAKNDKTIYSKIKDVRGQAVGQGIGTSISGRIDFMINTRLMNQLLRMNPLGGDSPKYDSMIHQVRKYLKDPTNLKNMEDLARVSDEQSGLTLNTLKQAALEKAKFGELRKNNLVKIYRVGSDSGSLANTKFGMGMPYTTAANAAGANKKDYIEVIPELFADEAYVRERLNLPDFKAEDLKRRPDIQAQLKADNLLGFIGDGTDLTLFSD